MKGPLILVSPQSQVTVRRSALNARTGFGGYGYGLEIFTHGILVLFPNPKLPDCGIQAEYLSHSLDPVYPGTEPVLLPSKTYKDTDTHYDIIMVPGGPTDPATVDAIDPSLFGFLKREAKYLLTICTGSWLLARTGLVNKKRATTNKSCFNIVTEDTKDKDRFHMLIGSSMMISTYGRLQVSLQVKISVLHCSST
ncbi:hypothetical protein D9758_018037 [Tetrapyrgos nigripes]|uniref:DJ-1/PfpI domain-containing protein n=1 Tax=Tetrapyrgos nigripes TaxID=182062 RepID=A0A8H5CBY2_9AGAR|nr:hypothetical protein D9758_018037 [Tetrapyrgos nigripes]